MVDTSFGDSDVQDSQVKNVANQAAIELVKAMQLNPSFRYTDLESPGIQYFYSMLQVYSSLYIRDIFSLAM